MAHFTVALGLGRKAGKEIVLRITIADDRTFQKLSSSLSWGPTIVHSGMLPGVYVAYIGNLS